MKKFYLLGLIFFSLHMSIAQEIHLFKNQLNETYLPTGVLFEKIKLPNSQLLKFTAENQQVITKPAQWLSFYHNMYQAEYQKSLMHFLSLKKQVKNDLKQKVFDIGILNYRYNKIKDEAWQNAQVRVVNDEIVVDSPDLIETRHLFAVSPVMKPKYTGIHPVFRFSKAYYFSNLPHEIDYIQVDFDDGRGKQTIKLNQDVRIRYASEGSKQIHIEVFLVDGSHFSSNFSFEVRLAAMPTPDETWSDYTADISWGGSAAVGDVAVFLGAGNTDFTRPVIISDGFDPGNIRNLDEIYDIVNQQNMVEQLRQQGYDLILVDFQGGDDYIQRNAMLIVKLLQDINARMQAAGTMKPVNQNVVVGPSMSGLITRYALDYMEQNNIPHNVRNWIAFDSPMRGANVPLGIQHWLRFYAEVVDVSGAQEALETLKGPAAKQMLTYYYTATSGNSAGHHSYYTNFFNELNQMGFPQQTRIVAIANGSGYGNGQPYSPGTKTIGYRYRKWYLDLDGDIWAVPNHTYQQIFEGLYDTALPFDETHDDVYVNNTDPLDSAPGGTRATFQELADTDTDDHGDIIAYYPDHAFIPSISSMCIQNTTDPYYNIDANLNNLQTPFDKLYYPNSNQDHIQITSESINWFKHEIINYAPYFTSTPATEIDEGSLYSYTLTAADENEWNSLEFEIVNLPAWLTYDATTHTLSGTPGYDDIGTHNVSLKVSDGLDDGTQDFQIIVSRKCTHAPLTVWNGNAWSNGLPDSSKFITISADYNTQTNGAINACSLQVDGGKQLIVESGQPVVIERDVENNGEIIVKNDASFVQTSDKALIAGNGLYKVERSVDNLIHYYDMVFWANPIYSTSYTFGDLSPDAWRYYSFDPAAQIWVFEYASTVLQPGLGYVVSAPANHTGGEINVLFSKNNDPFNNGVVEVPFTAGSIDPALLLGNPFPSAIDFHQFVADNPDANGSYHLWTNCAGLNGNNHQMAGYTTYSLSGSTAACHPGGFTATRYIPSTQGFFIETNTSNGTIKFKNSQRVAGYNDNFASRPQIHHRLWLNLTDDVGDFQQILIDFNPDATVSFDRLYDAVAMENTNGLNFYSLLGNKALAIQALPELHQQDVRLNLGYQPVANLQNYTISLAGFEGDLLQKNIYLIDRQLNTIHDLKQSDYSFVKMNTGFDQRFELLITENLLDIDNEYRNQISVYQSGEYLIIRSPEKEFQKISLIDIKGRVIYASNQLHTRFYKIPVHLRHQFIICRVNLGNKKFVKKLIIK